MIKRLTILFLALLTLANATTAAETAWFNGISEPVFDVTLSMSVPGIITSQPFKEGDSVKTNDVILSLDNRVEELEAQRRKLVMENKKNDWESTKTVAEKTGSVSRDELLKKEADYQVALVEYEMAEELLRRRKLIAPGSGVITEMYLRVGESCAAYQPLARVVDASRCFFTSNIEAQLLKGVKTNQPVVLEIDDANAPLRVRGRVVFVSPVVDSASGLQKIKAVFENKEGRVRPGLAGKMAFEQN